MFLNGKIGDNCYQYPLSTAWDISTASYDSVSLNLSPQGPGPEGLFFKPDGKALYVLDANTDKVFQYDL